MADVDERYRRDGRWIFDEPNRGAMDPDQPRSDNVRQTSPFGDRVDLGLTQEEDHLMSGTPASERAPTVQPAPSLAPCAASTHPIEPPNSPPVATGNEPEASAARPHRKAYNMSMSVYNLRSLEASARLWTSPKTTVTEDKEGQFIAKYKHGLDFPR